MMQDDKLQQLEEANTALREENATLRVLIAELLPLRSQVEALRSQVQALESYLSKDSRNSHLPPSSDRFARQPKKTRSLRQNSGKKAGGQPGHEGSTLLQVSEPDHVVVHAVKTCTFCQQDLQAEPVLQIERRQVWDLPPKRLLVWEHQSEQKSCPHCQQISKALFPTGVSAPVQYGPAFGAVGVYLVQQQLLPYERACETLRDLTGASVRVGTLQEWVARCAEHLRPIEMLLKERLQQAEVLHQDETGLDVMGKRMWMHVSATATLTHYAVHPKRGREVLETIGILPGFAGISVHDGWASYQSYTCQHALCNVHHLRELTFVEEQPHQEWASEMKTLLSLMLEAVQQARANGLLCLDPLERVDWKAQDVALLEQGWKANPPDPPIEGNKPTRGRSKQSPARNLLTRLAQSQEAVLRFLENFAVPFDNSQAERDIRMVKVQQKVSGSFRRLAGAEAFCRIRSFISSWRKQGGQILTALELALTGHPVAPLF